MESLQLPYWMEETMASSPPPSQHSLLNTEELMLFDNFANEFLITNDDSSLINTNMIVPSTVKSKSPEELLLELEEEIKDEPSWLHNHQEPLDFNSFKSFVETEVPEIQLEPQANMQKDTEALLHEFDSVCNAVGLQLTPPATPPLSPPALQSSPSPDFVTGAPIIYIMQEEQPTQEITIQDTDMLFNDALSETSDNSIELIDELVRDRLSEELSLDMDEVSSNDSDPSFSPRSEQSEQSSLSSFMSPRSESSFDTAGFDEEWTPAVIKPTANSKQKSKKSTDPKREKRPYGRPLHEKKARKKEQNKNAATRYRQKKKEELAVVLSEENGLLAEHTILMDKYNDIKREIKYLKKLMREILAARGGQL